MDGEGLKIPLELRKKERTDREVIEDIEKSLKKFEILMIKNLGLARGQIQDLDKAQTRRVEELREDFARFKKEIEAGKHGNR